MGRSAAASRGAIPRSSDAWSDPLGRVRDGLDLRAGPPALPLPRCDARSSSVRGEVRGLKKVFVLAAVLAAFGFAATAASASAGAQGPGPNGEHEVVVCKYVGTPGVDERLQTGKQPDRGGLPLAARLRSGGAWVSVCVRRRAGSVDRRSMDIRRALQRPERVSAGQRHDWRDDRRDDRRDQWPDDG